MARHLDPRPAPDLRYTEVRRRVRAQRAGEDLADSTEPLLVWEPQRPVPVYAFPESDVRLERFEPAPPPERAAPLRQGWMLDGTPAAWRYEDPDLAGHIALLWGAFEQWFEEDEEVFVHPRDPFHRIDLLASSREVSVEVEGREVARSRRPLLLFETGLPTRSYLPRVDVDLDALTPSALRTACAYKGEADHWGATIDGTLVDVAWTYRDPRPEVRRITDLVAFYDERVDITVDGVRQERPRTPWSWPPA